MSLVLSVITPAFNEELNLPRLHERLAAAMERLSIEWEWIIVDDHSRDGTFETIQRLAAGDARISGLRFSRNLGSHTAIACGLRHAKGRCAVVMAADLQDPPEVIADMLEHWREGSQVVWAAREARPGEAKRDIFFSHVYYTILRRVVGLSNMPSQGADFFLLDRVVIDALSGFKERNISLFALICWMGFRQKTLSYVKKARDCGVSGWNLGKKIKLTIDSVLPFSYLPIRIMSLAGVGFSLAGFLYGFVVLLNFVIRGSSPQGWSSLMTVILVLGGMQMLTLGVLGEYLWRVYDESRRRPMYMIESWCGAALSGRQAPSGDRAACASPAPGNHEPEE